MTCNLATVTEVFVDCRTDARINRTKQSTIYNAASNLVVFLAHNYIHFSFLKMKSTQSWHSWVVVVVAHGRWFVSLINLLLLLLFGPRLVLVGRLGNSSCCKYRLEMLFSCWIPRVQGRSTAANPRTRFPAPVNLAKIQREKYSLASDIDNLLSTIRMGNVWGSLFSLVHQRKQSVEPRCVIFLLGNHFAWLSSFVELSPTPSIVFTNGSAHRKHHTTEGPVGRRFRSLIDLPSYTWTCSSLV